MKKAQWLSSMVGMALFTAACSSAIGSTTLPGLQALINALND